MELTHSLVEGGHSGYLGTYQKAKNHNYCHGMKSKIKKFIASYNSFSKIKGKTFFLLVSYNHF